MGAAEEVEIEVKEGDILAGKYRVEKVLGAGGMGVVVAATHVVLHDRVALKFLLPSVAQHETTAARFLREAQAAVRIKSPHVARVIDVGTMEDTGSPYMVMEYLEGKDLSTIIETEGPLETSLACHYILQTCEALAAAHSAGIVHRDIKPANMFLTLSTDGEPVIKVLDFGISKVASDLGVSSLTQTQVSMGSPLYMSPEQMRSARDVDHRTDIWSLGVVLYELLTGTLPFVADSMPQLCALVLENTAPPMRLVRPDLPAGLEPVVARCLAKTPTERFADVAELAAALVPFAPPGSGAASAARVARIVGGSSIGNRTVTGVSAARASMSSMADPADTLSHATSFGRTGGAATEAPQKKSSPLIFVAAAAVLIGIAGAAFGLSRGSGEATAPATQPADTAAAIATSPPPGAEPSAAPATAAAPSATAGDDSTTEKREDADDKRQPTAQERAWWNKARERERQAEAKPADPPPAPQPADDGPGVFDTRK